MKLIGSLTEDQMRADLRSSNAALRDPSDATSPLPALLKGLGADLDAAYVLRWIPEQGEDFFEILDGNTRVLAIELSRDADGRPPIVESIPFARYRAWISRRSRHACLKFAIAAAMASECPPQSGQ